MLNDHQSDKWIVILTEFGVIWAKTHAGVEFVYLFDFCNVIFRQRNKRVIDSVCVCFAGHVALQNPALTMCFSVYPYRIPAVITHSATFNTTSPSRYKGIASIRRQGRGTHHYN